MSDNSFFNRYHHLEQPIGEWISVDEALPHYYERVLVVCTNPWSADPVRHVAMATYFGKPYSGKKPAWSQKRNVTHWMRLPALPNSQEKGDDNE